MADRSTARDFISLETALRVLNDCAYLAARMAREQGNPAAETLKRIALDTDAIIDGPASNG